jgi:hypothetical protein
MPAGRRNFHNTFLLRATLSPALLTVNRALDREPLALGYLETQQAGIDLLR